MTSIPANPAKTVGLGALIGHNHIHVLKPCDLCKAVCGKFCRVSHNHDFVGLTERFSYELSFWEVYVVKAQFRVDRGDPDDGEVNVELGYKVDSRRAERRKIRFGHLAAGQEDTIIVPSAEFARDLQSICDDGKVALAPEMARNPKGGCAAVDKEAHAIGDFFGRFFAYATFWLRPGHSSAGGRVPQKYCPANARRHGF